MRSFLFFWPSRRGGGFSQDFWIFWNSCSSGAFFCLNEISVFGFSAVSSFVLFKAYAFNQNLPSHSNTVGGGYISSDLASAILSLSNKNSTHKNARNCRNKPEFSVKALRSAERSSPCAPAEAHRWIFFAFSQGNLGNLVGNLEGIFRGFFLTHRTKAQKFRGKFRSIFRTKIRGSKKIFRAKFTLPTCHLKRSTFSSIRRRKTQFRGANVCPAFFEKMLYNWAFFAIFDKLWALYIYVCCSCQNRGHILAFSHVRIVAACARYNRGRVFWRYVYRGFGFFFFQNSVRRGFVSDLGCVFKRVLWARFSLFSGRFLASAVENVLYFAFFGVFGAHGFFGGGGRKKWTVLSTLFVLGFGDFFAFRRLCTKPLFLLVFRVVTGFWAKTTCGTPIFVVFLLVVQFRTCKCLG